jgi:hypothetical protein
MDLFPNPPGAYINHINVAEQKGLLSIKGFGPLLARGYKDGCQKEREGYLDRFHMRHFFRAAGKKMQALQRILKII